MQLTIYHSKIEKKTIDGIRRLAKKKKVAMSALILSLLRAHIERENAA